jgi:hypothetical protein
MDQAVIGWVDLVKIVLASGVVSAVVANIIQWWRESRKDAKKIATEATLNAIALVGVLDRYVAHCYSEIRKHDQAGYKTGSLGWCDTPELQLDGIKLDHFKPAVLAKLVWLKTERGLAFNAAHSALEKDQCPDDYNEDLMSIYGYSGFELSVVSQMLRRQYKLPQLLSEPVLERKAEYLKRYWDRAKPLILQ